MRRENRGRSRRNCEDRFGEFTGAAIGLHSRSRAERLRVLGWTPVEKRWRESFWRMRGLRGMLELLQASKILLLQRLVFENFYFVLSTPTSQFCMIYVSCAL